MTPMPCKHDRYRSWGYNDDSPFGGVDFCLDCGARRFGHDEGADFEWTAPLDTGVRNRYHTWFFPALSRDGHGTLRPSVEGHLIIDQGKIWGGRRIHTEPLEVYEAGPIEGWD